MRLGDEVSALVPMLDLLRQLGFEVKERSRRARCMLHGGSNSGSFAWTEGGLWHCHSCGRGGDKIKLVCEARGCGPSDALGFLAALAGVDISNVKVRREIAQRNRERRRQVAARARLCAIERRLLISLRNKIHRLENVRRDAAQRISKRGVTSDCDAEWEILKVVHSQLLRMVAGYYILSFASRRDRARFALQPDARTKMVNDALEAGVVVGDGGKVMEIAA